MAEIDSVTAQPRPAHCGDKDAVGSQTPGGSGDNPMNKPRRYRISISREGLCYLGVIGFILLGALIRDINLLMLLFGMLVGPLVCSWVLVVVSLRGVRVARQLPDEIIAGEPFNVQVALTNGKRRGHSWSVACDDRIEPAWVPTAAAPLRGGVLFWRTPAGETSVGSYRACLTQRGRYRWGPLSVSTRFPLGLIRRSMRFDNVATVTVLPRMGQMQPGWTRPNQTVAHNSRGVDRRRGTLEGEFLGLREWRPGDSARWIHWRTSARRGELMVRQFERQRNHDLALLVDLWQPANPSAADRERVELAVSVAATMLGETCRHGGCMVWLLAAGREPLVLQGPASLALFRDCLEALAVLEATPRDEHKDLFERGATQIPLGARILMLTTREEASAEASRMPAGLSAAGLEIWERLETIAVGAPGLAHYYHAV